MSYHHNKGQSDYNRGVYEEPYGTGENLFDFFTPGGGRRLEEGHQANREYRAGYQNAHEQAKYK